MVEKVSEVKVNTALNSGSVSDDSALLEWVDKKKKQNRLDEQPSSAAVTAQMLVQVLNGAFTGGEWQQKENKAANAAALPKPARPLSRSDDGLRQKVMLTASVRTEGTLIKPLATGDRPTAIAPDESERIYASRGDRRGRAARDGRHFSAVNRTGDTERGREPSS